mmetsp:Transcript_162207/g.311454  ORF Transcript_162207/g.311454 Transcript_162207/m.311454 type:complete len:992 (-) Transcript_162207:129-3104(-)
MPASEASGLDNSEDRESNTFFVYSEHGYAEASLDVVQSTSTRLTVLPVSNRLAVFATSALGAALFVACLVFIPSRGPLWAAVKDSTVLDDFPMPCNGHRCSAITPAILAYPGAVHLTERANELRKTADQVSVHAPASGILTFLNVSAGDGVSQGDVLAALIVGSEIVEITSPGFSTVRYVRSVRAGDSVKAWESLIILDKLLGLWNFTLKAGEKPILASADGFTVPRMGFFVSWGFGLKNGSYVSKGERLATVRGPGGSFVIKMPETGVLTGMHPLKPGAQVNAGGELAVYKLPLAGRNILHGPGLKHLNNPAGGVFKRWKVQTFDLIPNGGAVAEFEGSTGLLSTVTWDGPSGMVLAKQNLTPRDGLLPGAALVTVGQAVFVKHTVKVGDHVHKGHTLAIVQIGEHNKSIPARKNGTVLGIRPMTFQEPLGFDIQLTDDTFVVLGIHLPRLPPETANNTETRENTEGKWLASPLYTVSEGAKVSKGDVIALAKEVKATTMLASAAKAGDSEIVVADTTGLAIGMQIEISDGISSERKRIVSISNNRRLSGGARRLAAGTLMLNSPLSSSYASIATVEAEEPLQEVKFRAALDGYAHLQTLRPGAMIGPQDDVFDIDQNAPFSWLSLILVLCCCLPCVAGVCWLVWSYLKSRPRDAISAPVSDFRPRDVGEDDEDEQEIVTAPEPEPVAAPEPEPAPAPAPVVPAPPPGVPIYFDNEPYYFEYRPLGITFLTEVPIKIDGFTFNSYGRTLGLKQGQRITRIKDVDVREDHHYSHVDSLLLSAVEELPHWPLRIDFQTNTNEIRKFYFRHRPLGIRFGMQLPIRIASFKPYSLAQRAGVEVDWKIVRIAEEGTTQDDMASINIKTNKAGFEHVDKHLLKGLEHLPYWPVPLEFKTASGEMKTINVQQRPHGITFSDETGGVKVKRVEPRSVAEELGIQIGWDLVGIMDDVITQGQALKRSEKELQEMMQHLPEKSSSRQKSPARQGSTVTSY